MALTRDFKETVHARIATDYALARAGRVVAYGSFTTVIRNP